MSADRVETDRVRVEALIERWRQAAIESIAESSRIRSVTHKQTGAEDRCLTRAELWRKCAGELESALREALSAPEAPQDCGCDFAYAGGHDISCPKARRVSGDPAPARPEVVAEAERLLKDITPGEWKWFNYPDGRKLLSGEPRAVIHCPDAPMTIDPPDAALIAAAPRLVRQLLAALSSASVAPWQPIATAPKMRKVIVFYRNELGKNRTVLACYYKVRSLEMEDDYAEVGEYDDATGASYAPEGWYEEHDSGEPLMRLQGEPTHWQPLPSPPSPPGSQEPQV